MRSTKERPLLHDLFASGIPIGEKLVRTLCVYVFLLVGLRLAGKRELGQLNPFDLVVLLLLSNTVQNAIIGNDNSLIGGVVGASALLLINWLVARLLYNHPLLSRWIEGDPDLLIKNGKIQHTHLKRELITHADLESAARKQGLEGLEHVESCRLEVGGALTFEAKAPTAEQKRQHELLTRLDALAKTNEQLMSRLAAIEHGMPLRLLESPPQ